MTDTDSVSEGRVRELQEEAQRFADVRLILGSLTECAFILDEDAIIRYATPNVGRVFCGRSFESVEGLPIENVVGEWIREFLPLGRATICDPQSNEYLRRIEDSSGELNHVAVVVESVNSSIGSTLIRCRRAGGIDLKDVAESKRKRYERLVEQLPGQYFFFGLNQGGEITYLSQSVKDVTGHDADAVIGKNWLEFVDVGRVENQNLEDRHRRYFQGENPPRQQAVILDACGKPRVVEVLDYPVIDSAGTVIEIEGIVHDITESRAVEVATRRQLELSVAERTAELNHATQLYRSIVDLQTQFIVRWLPDGTRTFVNPAYCEYSQKTAEEMLGKPIRRMLDPSTKMVYLRDLQNLTTQNSRISREVSFVEADGREVSQHWIDQGVFDANGNLIEIQSMGRDISSERRRAAKDRQAQMFRAKMDTLSPRERQVMGLVTEGKANKVIASNLDLSVKTVEKHRSSMMRKLQMQSVAELVRNVLVVEGEI